VAERIKWGRPTLAAETAATVTVLVCILRVTVMAAAVVAAAAEAVAAEAAAAAAALRVRMGPPKQAAELDPHKPVDPDPGRA
jgi:transcriptional regulator of nitric oxide reductase